MYGDGSGEEGGGGGRGVKNRKPKGWEEVGGCMMKHKSVLPVETSTQHSQARIKLLTLEQRAKSILVLEF